jgi:lipopolysaccharide/colanic/teichoic acid biosynthesis glycosyltransferase
MTSLALKSLFDRVVSLLLLPLLLPLIAIIAILVKLEHPRLPIFFIDTVAGRGGRPFRFVKFRTMLPHPIDYNQRPEIFIGNPLVTRVGQRLRRFKLDEVPQVLHVLMGQMSIVGPRPMDCQRYERASEFFRQRVMVRPGLTGIAQVSGNIHLTWEERMEMDVWYIQHWSPRLDLEIIYRTFGVIIFGETILEELANNCRLRDHSVRVRRPGEAA